MAGTPFIHRTLAATLLLLAGCQRDTPRVIDEAGLFAESESQRLALFHDLLLADHAIDYRVLTVATAADINRLAVQRFGELGVGALSPTAYGLLLVIDPLNQQLRMEVGYGLEGYFPDAFVAYIENRQMLPFFAAGRLADGVLATTELIVDRAQRYRLGEAAFTAPAPDGSGGAGATARMGVTAAPPPAAGQRIVPPAGPGGEPGDTLARYLAAMARRDADPNLPIYSPDTRALLREWVVTPAQMDGMVAAYRGCEPQPAQVSAGGSRAVIRYPIAQRRCAPWFFQRSGDAWLLDLTMMNRAVRFGRDNSWRFDFSVEHPYLFAFEDWEFDSHGFPARAR